MQSVDAVRYRSIIHAVTTIQQKEGFKRLFRGMGAMITGAGPAHAMYFAGYERLKYNFTLFANDGMKNSSLANGKPLIWGALPVKELRKWQYFVMTNSHFYVE